MESPTSTTSDIDCCPSIGVELADIFSSLEDLNLAGLIQHQEQEQLALGFTCDVFRAWSIKHNKRVAIKRIRCFLMDDICFKNSLCREVRLWSRLKHPNVLPLLGFFLEGKGALPNLVSEWMGGGTLTRYIKDHPLDALEISKILYGIAAGIRYIHDEHNMIHADLKSSNILVSSDGRPVLADFGLSVSTMSASLAATTFHGQKGSLRWMAKELHSAKSTENLPKHTTMSDIWALGMIISELLTRKIPYESVHDRYVASVILSGQLPQKPDFVNIQSQHVLDILWKIGQQCWKDNPDQRPSASEVLEKLEILGVGFSMGRAIGTEELCVEYHLENEALLEDTPLHVNSLNAALSDALEREKANVSEMKHKIHELETKVADLEWDLEFERRKKVSIEF